MIDDNLTRPPDADDLFSLVEKMKIGLTANAVGDSENVIDNEDYKRIRRVLLSSTILKDLIPGFIKQCRTTEEFWEFIKGEYRSYSERRLFLSSIFNPMLDVLEEGETDVSSLYEKKELLGQGGFGQVYRYEHKLLGMNFAVKVFAPAFSEGGEGHLERFFREARILFKLNHPNIIKVHDVGITGKRPYIRMELFEGRNLNKVLQDYGKVSPAKALILVETIADALRHAHEEVGVVHRDLKPSNIMVARPNQFRIIDFGLGVFVENDLVSRITRTGEAVAGGYFTAPELLTNPTLIDPRSDIYSMGAIWFNLVVGQPPAGSRIKDILEDVDGITSNYASVILKCLDNIDQRFASSSELIAAISQLKSEENWLE